MNNKSMLIKQDINFLDKPLWFQNLKSDELTHVWTDIEGYEYRTGYKLPDKVDALFLMYILLKSQKNGYCNKIESSKYEILKECGYSTTDPRYYERLEDSLERWKNITIKFHETFYDGKQYKTHIFGIINEASINKDNGKIKININESWLLKIKESEFFKYINFYYYKALKRPLSRRLYELLCKTFKGRNEWSINLIKLGAKLTVCGRTKKDGKKIFASDVLVVLKPAINELNKLAMVPDIIAKTGIAKEDLFTIEYNITGEKQDRIIHFKKIPVYQETYNSTKASQTEAIPQPPDNDPQNAELFNRLLNFKVSKTKATSILKKYPVDQIKNNLDYTDSQIDKISNVPGYVVKAIDENYHATQKIEPAFPDLKKGDYIYIPHPEIKGDSLSIQFMGKWPIITHERTFHKKDILEGFRNGTIRKAVS